VQDRLARFEWLIALGIAGAAIAWAWRLQAYQVFRLWDSDEYFLMAEQLAAGVQVTAATPYAFRLLTPWLAAQCCPDDIQRGFLIVNLVAGIAIALLLVAWLRLFVARADIRLLIVAAYALQWHAPLRFSFYYPAYVDPPFQAFMLGGLVLAHQLWRRPSIAVGIAYVVVTMAGTLAREMMLLVPVAGLAGMVLTRGRRDPHAWGWQAAALLGGGAVFLAARLGTDPRQGYTFLDAILLHLTNKPPESLLLTWLLTFGPLLAVVVYDWRATRRFLMERPDLALLLAGCVGLAYVGGHDTERYLFWAMPVVYSLIALSLERQSRVLSGAVVMVLVVGQVLAQRVFFPIPDPETTAMATPLSDVPGAAARAYAVLNRVFVIDDFHWNLWSNFGSRPFHLVQLAFYGALAAAIVALMHRNASRARTVLAS
jgi:hypothetical protein